MINPDIQKLRTVLMVSKTLNFSEAAYELNFTPSAISKQVISVEKSLGVTDNFSGTDILYWYTSTFSIAGNIAGYCRDGTKNSFAGDRGDASR